MTVYQKPHKRRYGTEFHLRKDDWKRLNGPKLKDINLKELEKKLSALRTSAEQVIEKITPFSFMAFEEIFLGNRLKKSAHSDELKNKAITSRMLSDWFDCTIAVLKKQEQVGTAGLYQTTINSINKFKSNLLVHDVTMAFLLDYEGQLIKEAKSLATIGIYMRHLRAIINNAIKEEIISKDAYPFKEYKIPTGQNTKKALKNFDIEKILMYQPRILHQEKALDFWIFYYLCNGMNFADIISLKPQNISVYAPLILVPRAFRVF